MSPFYSPQSVGLMGLSLVILGPLSCDPDPPIGCLLWLRPSVELRRDDRPYRTRGIKLRWDELAGLTWTINPASTEDLLSWLAWLEQSIQRRLKTCWAAGLAWTINPASTEDLLSWLAWLEQSIQHRLKTCWTGWLDLNNQSSVDWRLVELAGLDVVYPCQSTVHQASSLLRRRRLFFDPGRSVPVQ